MTPMQVVRRIAQAALVLLATFTLAFLLLSALPGDAVQARYANPDLGLSAEQIEQIRNDLGADRPLPLQYLLALTGFLTGNLGYSVNSGTAVATMIRHALPGTLVLALVGFLAALLLASAVALLASLPRWGWLRRAVRSLPALMVSMPAFWLGIMLIQVLSFRLGLVPVIGASPAQQLVLPAMTLAVPIAAPLAQVLVRSIDEVQGQSFVTVVRARGAGEAWLFFRNVLRNALLPALTMAGILFGELVGGAVVTEAVFGRNGLGSLTVQAVANRDTPVILAVVVISATAYVLINLAVDLLYPVLDPRLRRSNAA